MKGLFVKDMKLLFGQKRVLLVLLVQCVFFAVMGVGSFTVTMMGMLLLVLTTGTINYDEADNGYAFLLTLPFTRREYVLEKYLLGVTGGLLGVIVGLVSAWGVAMAGGGQGGMQEPLMTAAAAAFVVCAGLAIILPVQIRFGSERGRTVLYIVPVCIALAGMLIGKMLPSGMRAAVKNALRYLDQNVSVWRAAGGIFALCLLLLIISVPIAVRLMEKKEF